MTRNSSLPSSRTASTTSSISYRNCVRPRPAAIRCAIHPCLPVLRNRCPKYWKLSGRSGTTTNWGPGATSRAGASPAPTPYEDVQPRFVVELDLEDHIMDNPSNINRSLKLSRSRALYAEAQKLLPGGVNSPVRAFRAVGGEPVFIDHAHGPYLYDVDGNRYLDYVQSWGPMILGHAHPEVLQAVVQASMRGFSFGAPTQAESELAKLVMKSIPSIEMVRFVNSGTEATMSALRLARAATGRDRVVKCAGAYHGHADLLLVEAGSGVATLGIPGSPGVPEAAVRDTLVVPYNDAAAVEELLAAEGDRVAAVIVEPVAGNMGCVPPRPGYLEALRELTARHGALLVFDEVMTGFRVAYGGAQELYGVTPDLTCLGKVIGGGLPVGAYGGPVALMERVAPSGPVYQAGTLSGNPLAMAAGCATLDELRDGAAYARLEALG